VGEDGEVPGFGWSYIRMDPEGNTIGLFEARRAAPRRARKASKKSRR
jgi:hypothetical protein